MTRTDNTAKSDKGIFPDSTGTVSRSLFKQQVLFILLSVALFSLSMPGRPFPWLAWIAIAPFFVALSNAKPFRGFCLGAIFGWLIWLTSAWWLYSPLRDIAGMSSAAAVGFTVVGCFVMGLPYAVAGAAVCRLRNRTGVVRATGNAAIFTLAITFLTPIFQGSPAHTQYLYPIVLQVLELGGAPFLLFLILTVNAFLAEFIFNYQTRRMFAWKPFVTAVVILVVTFGYGAIRLSQFESTMQSAPREQWITIGAIQPNIPIFVAPERQPTPDAISNNLFSAIAQARQLAAENPEIDLLVFPENPATFVFNEDAVRRAALGELIKETGKPVLLNVDAIDTKGRGSDAPRYNVAVLLDANRNLAGNYPKIKRVPFVEYVPGEEKVPRLRKWFPKSLRVLEGDGPKVFEVVSGVRVIPLICYEGTISSFTREFVKLGGNVIVNQVNDSWFLRTPASEVHLALTLFRAMEFRVPLVRVTNAGIGAHVQANGKIVPGSRTGLFIETATAFPLYIPLERSVYAKVGNFWMIGFLALLPFYLRKSGSPGR